MEDVARHAGVSLGTVSNVLNNPGIVSESTRQKVEQSISALGFRRNSVARSLAVGRADTIGFAIVDLANSFFVDIARGVEQLTDERGYRVLLGNSDVELRKQNSYLSLFEESRLAGAILAPLDASLDAAAELKSRGLPIVCVNWPAIDDQSCGVAVDEEHGGYIAARHVIETGRRRLLFAGGPRTLTAVEHRWRGVQRACAETPGVSIDFLETRRLTVAAGLEVGRALAGMAGQDRPDALVAAADALASGAVQAMLYEGLSVPDDVAVIGYDNNHFAADHVVPISTVGQPGVEMGRLAAQLLLEEIEQPDSHRHRTITLKPQLLVRRSTARSTT